MSSWTKVSRCKNCGKIYEYGIPEICRKCGTNISTRNIALKFLGIDRCMIPTSNLEDIVAKRKWFKWIFKEASE